MCDYVILRKNLGTTVSDWEWCLSGMSFCSKPVHNPATTRIASYRWRVLGSTLLYLTPTSVPSLQLSDTALDKECFQDEMGLVRLLPSGSRLALAL